MSIGFKVTGLDEIINSLGAMNNDLSVVRAAVLNEGARFLVNEAKRNVHVVSGRLRNSIQIEPLTEPYAVRVAAVTPYAGIENSREGKKRQTAKSLPPYGPHNYFTRAIETFQTQFTSRIKLSVDRLWDKHRTR